MIPSAIALVANVMGMAQSPSVSSEAETFIAQELELSRYRAAAVDLNDDGPAEVIVYATAPQSCGSGGCNLYILARTGGTYRIVTKATLTRLPIRVLRTTSHGWRDLGVQVAGGGLLNGYESRLRFDGRTYPSNPTVAPAAPAGEVSGQIVLQ